MSQHKKYLLDRFPELAPIEKPFDDAFELLRSTIEGGGTIFTCGNGGSAADAEHIVGELMKGFLLERPLTQKHSEALAEACGQSEAEKLANALQEGIKAVSLVGHPSLATAFANDVDPTMVFAQQLHVLGEPGDALIAITTSGNSKNVINALKVAKARGVASVALTGEGGGLCAHWADVLLAVPESETHKAQESHLPIYHALCAMLEEKFHGAG